MCEICWTNSCDSCQKSLRNAELTKKSNGVGSPILDVDFGNLIGGTVTDIGFARVSGIEGGLTIDFIRDGKEHRIVYGFNDLGLWKEFES